MCQMFESFHEQQSKSQFFVYNFTLLKFQRHITRIIKIFSQKSGGGFRFFFFWFFGRGFYKFLFHFKYIFLHYVDQLHAFTEAI